MVAFNIKLCDSMKRVALICAYNEEKNVGKVVKATKREVERIIVVDDGSRDKTYDKLRKLKGKGITVISYQPNRGKGYATKTGIEEFLRGSGDVLITLDADGQHDPTQITSLSELVESGAADVVIGSRYSKKGVDKFPPIRVFFNVIVNIVVLLVTGQFFADVSSGYRAYSREVIKSVAKKLDVVDFGIEPEILRLCVENNYRIATVPVSCSYETGRKPNFVRLARGYMNFAFKYKGEIIRRLLKVGR